MRYDKYYVHMWRNGECRTTRNWYLCLPNTVFYTFRPIKSRIVGCFNYLQTTYINCLTSYSDMLIR